MAKRFIRTLSRAVDNIVLLTLLVCLIFAAYALWDTHQLLAAADANQFATYKPTNEETKSFEDLRAMNNDVIGSARNQPAIALGIMLCGPLMADASFSISEDHGCKA